jgi:sRNA-binding protein
LAIGTGAEIIQRCPDLPPVRVQRFLGYWCGCTDYVTSFLYTKHRIGLEGEPAAPLTFEEIAFAGRKLAALRHKRRPKRENTEKAAAVALSVVGAKLGSEADLQNVLDAVLTIVGAEEAP